MRILVILGSIRKGRQGQKVYDWLKDKLKGDEYEFVDLKDWNLPIFDNELSPKRKPEYTGIARKWQDLIKSADGFIIVTPEYNHGYSPALKNALDYLWYEWNGKPVTFVSYGGESGGIRATEQLVQVTVELQMRPLRNQVHIPYIWTFESKEAIDNQEAFGKKLEATITQLKEEIK